MWEREFGLISPYRTSENSQWEWKENPAYPLQIHKGEIETVMNKLSITG